MNTLSYFLKNVIKTKSIVPKETKYKLQFLFKRNFKNNTNKNNQNQLYPALLGS